MIRLYINNKIIFVPKNTSILEACEEVGISLPRFCYHERLNVAGNCRMCLVEIEKTPKPVAACAFPVIPDMRVFTNSPLVKKARENVLEFLLINHPLDCPICDQGGECDLQEQSLHYGLDRSRFFFKKRSVQDKNLGPLIKTIMTRCIHCTRCVRFFQDILCDNLGTTLRGIQTEISLYKKGFLISELSGNVIDLCPVGALTSKPYAFIARPWEIQSIKTIDLFDSLGSNIRIDTKETNILRIVPILNDSINEEWISNKVRFSFDTFLSKRIMTPFLKNNNILKASKWSLILQKFYTIKKNVKSSDILFICGNNLDLETMLTIKQLTQNLQCQLISEQVLNLNNNLLAFTRFNVTLNDILISDLCLMVATNLRFEATLLNIRLKKMLLSNSVIIASIGLTEKNIYQMLSLGTSIKSLITLIEGKHFFCKNLKKAKNPLIIIGTSAQKRIDFEAILNIIFYFKNFIKIFSASWFGINFLPLHAGNVGLKFISISTNSKVLINNKKLIFLIGVSNYEKALKNISQDSFIISQSSFFDPLLENVDIVCPSKTFLEKEGNFINLEGQIQKTNLVFSSSSLVRSDSQILNIFFLNNFFLKKKINSLNFNCFKSNKFLFLKYLNYFPKKTFSLLLKTSFINCFSNNYLTDNLTKNSLTMNKCYFIFKQQYTNFI